MRTVRYSGVLSGAALSGLLVLAADAAETARTDRLKSVRTWGYQLQHADPVQLARTDCDMLVIDYANDRKPLGRKDLELIRGSRQPSPVILAYLSIGEAESYRFYWRTDWAPGKPEWLGAENPLWKENFAVRFWSAAWQEILLSPDGYVSQIVEAGFDGIYLDRVDVFADWEAERPGARQDMIELVAKIASHGRRLSPGFLVVPQNGEALLRDKSYRTTIDAIAKEDLFFGAEKDFSRNAESETTASLAYLDEARRAGLPVFLVEYLKDSKSISAVLDQARTLGFIPLIARRSLSATPACRP